MNKETNKLISVVLLGLLGAILGYTASQFYPLWGGILALGQPFSPARQSLIPGHVVAFAFVGIALGLYVNKTNKN